MSALRSLIDRLDTAGMDSWEALAVKAGYEDYVAVARTLDVDQAFWRSLFVNDAASRGTALVFETRLGALSTRLAASFGSVVSCHASDIAAARTRRRVEDLNIGNIRVVVAREPAELDFAGERLAAVVFYGIGGDMTQQWGGDPSRLLESLMRKIPDWLADEGMLIVSEDNRSAYRRSPAAANADDHRGGIALARMQRMIRRRFPHSDLYVCSGTLTPDHAPPPDFVHRDAFRRGLILPKNLLAAAKGRILNSKPARLLWPSFLMIASRRPVRTSLQAILARPDVRDSSGWSSEDRIAVKRIVAGNSGVSVIIAGPVNRDDADVVARISSHAAAARFCRNNARALKILSRTAVADSVPRLICEGTWQGREYTLESSCPGYEANPGIPDIDALTRQGIDTLRSLHRQTGRWTHVTEEDFQRLVVPFIQDIAVHCAPDLRERLMALMARLRDAMVGRGAFLGCVHGDFKLGNILFDRSRKLAGIIDWDGFSENGLQIFDYLTLMMYKMAYENNRGFVDIYLEHILPWKLLSSGAHLVDDVLSGMIGDEDGFLPARIAFWFILLSSRFDPINKRHTAWQHRYLLPVLPVLEKIRLSGGCHP